MVSPSGFKGDFLEATLLFPFFLFLLDDLKLRVTPLVKGGSLFFPYTPNLSELTLIDLPNFSEIS